MQLVSSIHPTNSFYSSARMLCTQVIMTLYQGCVHITTELQKDKSTDCGHHVYKAAYGLPTLARRAAASTRDTVRKIPAEE